MVIEAHTVWRATRTPEGPATLRLRDGAGGPVSDASSAVAVAAWGPGAAWALRHSAELVGAHDDHPETIQAALPSGPVREAHRRRSAVRMGASRSLTEALIPIILEQKVTTIEARRAFRALMRRYGEPAPGPAGGHGLRLRPDPAVLARVPYHELHRLGIERRRAEVIARVCARAARLDRLAATAEAPPAVARPGDDQPGARSPSDEHLGCRSLGDGPLGDGRPSDDQPGTGVGGEQSRAARAASSAAAQAALVSLPGIGPWTATMLAQQVFGDPDAVVVGDYHLPDIVAWNLAGEARATDERMLELLEPYRGQRGRVVRLIVGAGAGKPQFGPRHPIRSIASI